MVITLLRLRALLVALITPPRNFDPIELSELAVAACGLDGDACGVNKGIVKGVSTLQSHFHSIQALPTKQRVTHINAIHFTTRPAK
jgi:hypothetical protein